MYRKLHVDGLAFHSTGYNQETAQRVKNQLEATLNTTCEIRDYGVEIVKIDLGMNVTKWNKVEGFSLWMPEIDVARSWAHVG